MRRALPLVLAACLLGPLAADAARPDSPRSVVQSRHLWATVNICDTAKNPNTIGLRASMPGSGRTGERMYMRFQVQFFSRRDRKWHNITRGSADSGFRYVGHGRYKARQSGWSFEFLPPPGGGSHVLRGAVTFEWRKRGEVVRRARKRTTAGHRSARGSDPPRYSRSLCEIS